MSSNTNLTGSCKKGHVFALEYHKLIWPLSFVLKTICYKNIRILVIVTFCSLKNTEKIHMKTIQENSFVLRSATLEKNKLRNS